MKDIVLSPEDHLTEVADLTGRMLAADVLRVLDRHYFGYNWAVMVDQLGRVVTIINRSLVSALNSNMEYGYVLHEQTIRDDPSRKCVINAGGEILERANMPRGPWDGQTYPTKIEGVQEKHQPILNQEGMPIILVPEIEAALK